MTGVTQGGIAVEVPPGNGRGRGPGPISRAEATRMRAALARVLAEAGYNVRDRARILGVPKSTLHEWERRTPEACTGPAS